MKRLARYTLALLAVFALLLQPFDADAKSSKKKKSTMGMLKCVGLVIECGAPHNTVKTKKYRKCVKKMKKVDRQCAKINKKIFQCLKRQKCSGKKGPKAQKCRLGCNFKAVALTEMKRMQKCIKKCGKDFECGAKCTFAIK